MGTSESKSESDGKQQQTSLCFQNRKDGNKKRRKIARSKSNAGRDESGSRSTHWISPPEQMHASIDAVLGNFEGFHTFQESLRRGFSSENCPRDSNAFPSKTEVKTPELPHGWTASQLIQLKDAVHRTASVLQIKSPGFFVLQVILMFVFVFSVLSAHPAYARRCAGSPSRPFLSCPRKNSFSRGFRWSLWRSLLGTSGTRLARADGGRVP
jgi:hypothetical protein